METVSTFLQMLDKADTRFKKMQEQSRMTGSSMKRAISDRHMRWPYS